MIDRRNFIYTCGALLPLPYLESISLANQNNTTKNLVIVFSPNGMNMDSWNLKQESGIIGELSPTLSELKEHKTDIIICGGLAQTKARANGDGGGDHARSMSTFLTGVQIKKTDGANITAGISADQIAANFFKSSYRLPSLQIGIESGKTAGNCDSGYSCAYSSTISWSNPHLPLPVDHHPKTIFDRIYGDGQKQDLRKIDAAKSILDFGLSQINSLNNELDGADKRKLDEYLHSVREVERKIQLESNIPKEPDSSRVLFSDKPEKFSDHAKLLIDLIVLALQTNSTRIVTLTLGNEGSNRSYKEIGIDEGHHELSHHQNSEDKLAKIAQINQLHTQQVNYLLSKLKQAGIFNETVVAYGCGIEDGNSHKHHDLPIIVAGGGINGNRYNIYDKETPLNNLWLGLLHHIGVTINGLSLGDSNNIILL